MDTKQPFPSSSSETEPPPPSYNEIDSSASSYYSAQIRSQLANLTVQIAAQQTQNNLLSDANNDHILSLLTAEILTYLSKFARSGCPKGALILVPSAGITDENAVPVDLDFTNQGPGTYGVVVRVTGKDKSGEMWYWKDEEMAESLAAQLRPPPPPPSERTLPPRTEEVVQQQQPQPSSRGFWGRKKSVVKNEREPTNRGIVEDAKKAAPAPSEDKVHMSVKAEEVVFRTENDFGIYETVRGWGIVVRLKVVQGR